ncbi:MAG: arginase family protein [Chloroflexi bacterium SZAS-1]|nr:arginase family protein [Chloroflexi bacterium SZAS-1]
MNVSLLAVPYNLDQLRVGMGQAPAALLQAGLAEQLAAQGHATLLETVSIPASDMPREECIGRIQAALAVVVTQARAAGRFPLVLGGDCLVALGTLAGLARPADTGIVWIDAHGDFNTPAISISGYLGGMPLACAVGHGLEALRDACGLMPIAEQHVALVGVRDLDPLEAQALERSAVTVVPTQGVIDHSPKLDAILTSLAALPQIYLHIDIDVLDMAEAPGVDFPTSHGLHIEQLLWLVQQVAAQGKLAALALTAVNPTKDSGGRTVQAALQVISAALG